VVFWHRSTTGSVARSRMSCVCIIPKKRGNESGAWRLLRGWGMLASSKSKWTIQNSTKHWPSLFLATTPRFWCIPHSCGGFQQYSSRAVVASALCWAGGRCLKLPTTCDWGYRWQRGVRLESSAASCWHLWSTGFCNRDPKA